MGAGVAEQTKASGATRTVAGSKSGHGRHFSSGRYGVWSEGPPSPTRTWQIPSYRCPLENSAKLINTRKPTVPFHTVKNHLMV